VTSDAGLLLVAQIEEEVGLLRSLAAVIDDPRQLSKCRHSTLELLTQRVMALVAGYEDCNDHTLLRRDPGLKTATKRRLSGSDLASQPTLSLTTTSSAATPSAGSTS
jgi:hypothetical protein